MTSKRYLGNIITDTPTAPAGPYENDAASGVWSLAEANTYTAAGLWPTAGNANIANRGIFAGGYTGSNSNVIDYVNIASTGNALDFGDLSAAKYNFASLSSATRGLFAGAQNFINTIDYIVLSTTGNAQDFGDLSTTSGNGEGCSSSTRGIFNIGLTATDTYSNILEYVTIGSTGNTTDFGDMTVARRSAGACSSPTRGVWAGGSIGGGPPFNTNVIDYVTIASTGNATDFGDLSSAADARSNVSSSTRGVFHFSTTTLEYITIASTGNSVTFGNLVSARASMKGCSNTERGLFAGNAASSNVIEYITIATTGNGTDFGDLTVARGYGNGCSGGHGGLAA